jgi:hypothetical protein
MVGCSWLIPLYRIFTLSRSRSADLPLGEELEFVAGPVICIAQLLPRGEELEFVAGPATCIAQLLPRGEELEFVAGPAICIAQLLPLGEEFGGRVGICGGPRDLHCPTLTPGGRVGICGGPRDLHCLFCQSDSYLICRGLVGLALSGWLYMEVMWNLVEDPDDGDDIQPGQTRM